MAPRVLFFPAARSDIRCSSLSLSIDSSALGFISLCYDSAADHALVVPFQGDVHNKEAK